MEGEGKVKIEIEYCNNIDQGEVEIEENILNIKYAINGTGKSSIVKAIEYFIKDKNKNTDELMKLKPFKHYDDKNIEPNINGIENISNVKVFNESYINDFIFQPDELVKGSFDIFIRNDEYEEGMKEIDKLITTINEMFQKNEEIEKLINDFEELSDSFGRPTKNGIHGSSKISKAFKDGNKVANIPSEIEEYKDYIKSEINYKWVKWQINGQKYLNISNYCPYCTSLIDDRKEKIQSISKHFDPKSVEHLNKVINVFKRLNDYFIEDTRDKINEFITSIDGYSEDEVQFLIDIKDQIDRLKDKLKDIKNIGFQTLKNVDEIIDVIKKLKIDLRLYSHLNSANTQKYISIINNSIDDILKEAGVLKGKIINQKKYIEDTISEYKEQMNNFLLNAGYKYKVDMVDDGHGEYKLKLKHIEINQEIKEVDSKLSFGEKNAFSLVLFMFDALNEDPDLIILDDPISSFDKNKKYAIIDMLFRSSNSFREKTVLLLTHDFDPVLDMVYHHRNIFQVPNASFLENNNGNLIEKSINKDDIKTFMDITEENIKTLSEDINKLIYLRRYYEINNEKGNAYQLISNLVHKRDTPIIKENNDDEREMNINEIEDATHEIQNWIDEFDYEDLLSIVKDDYKMKLIYNKSSNNYEKLQIYRIIFDEDRCNSVIQKFINETFHIENDYIYQLNPCKYQLVPQFVIKECNKNIRSLIQ
jgi:energy-coupling factor transporter ATP-binding protein EcfA2